jgi:hypothetical protein
MYEGDNMLLFNIINNKLEYNKIHINKRYNNWFLIAKKVITMIINSDDILPFSNKI